MANNDNKPADLPLGVAETASLYMVHANHLGRPIRITDSTKATVWQAVYKPWGETQSISGTRTNNLRLPGQYFQIETNLAYNWHRHYDPVTGRYTQPDPLRFVDGPSLYAYAKNSPFKYSDRNGLEVGATGGLNYDSSSDVNAPSNLPDLSPSPPPPDESIWDQLANLVNPAQECGTECPPCKNIAAGTIGYRLDATGRSHGGITTPHLHLYQVNQNPMCKCFGNNTGQVIKPPPPPGSIDVTAGLPPP